MITRASRYFYYRRNNDIIGIKNYITFYGITGRVLEDAYKDIYSDKMELIRFLYKLDRKRILEYVNRRLNDKDNSDRWDENRRKMKKELRNLIIEDLIK